MRFGSLGRLRATERDPIRAPWLNGALDLWGQSSRSTPFRADEVDHLAIIPSVHTEVPTIDGKHLGSGMQLGHDDDRCIGKVHLAITRHRGPDAGPMGREIEGRLDGFALQQLKQGIHR